jgi:hypothetical protein
MLRHITGSKCQVEAEKWHVAADDARARGEALFPDPSDVYAAVWSGPATNPAAEHPAYIRDEVRLFCVSPAKTRRQCELGALHALGILGVTSAPMAEGDLPRMLDGVAQAGGIIVYLGNGDGSHTKIRAAVFGDLLRAVQKALVERSPLVPVFNGSFDGSKVDEGMLFLEATSGLAKAL